MRAQQTLTLYHCTLSDRAEQILRNGFQDTPYDASEQPLTYVSAGQGLSIDGGRYWV